MPLPLLLLLPLLPNALVRTTPHVCSNLVPIHTPHAPLIPTRACSTPIIYACSNALVPIHSSHTPSITPTLPHPHLHLQL